MIFSSILATALSWGGLTSAFAQEDFDVVLEGFQEVPANFTAGSGSFFLRNSTPFLFELDYDLEGEIVQAHIHLGQAGVNGGVMVWLCANPDFVPAEIDPPLDTPECDGMSGNVVGQLTAASVVGPAEQGIEPGEGANALAAIRAGVAYVNVHSDLFPAGEVRGQLILSEPDGDDLREDLDELRDDLEGHSHKYRTGRGKGHNKVKVETSMPNFGR